MSDCSTDNPSFCHWWVVKLFLLNIYIVCICKLISLFIDTVIITWWSLLRQVIQSHNVADIKIKSNRYVLVFSILQISISIHVYKVRKVIHHLDPVVRKLILFVRWLAKYCFYRKYSHLLSLDLPLSKITTISTD